jgi:hypothetical protein
MTFAAKLGSFFAQRARADIAAGGRIEQNGSGATAAE